MTASGPTTLPPVYTPQTPALTLSGAGHDTSLHQNDRDELRALWTKLGLGTSTPTAATVLLGNGTGTSAFGTAVKTTLVAGSGSNVTTTSTSLADLDSATMSTSYVSTGGVLNVLVIATVNNDTLGSYTTLGVSINAADTLGTGYQPGVANYRGAVIAMGRSALAAGTYTIKPRWRVSANTGLSVGGERWMLIVETK